MNSIVERILNLDCPRKVEINAIYKELWYYEPFEIATKKMEMDNIIIILMEDELGNIGVGDTFFINDSDLEIIKKVNPEEVLLGRISVADNIKLGVEMAYLDLIAKRNKLRFGSLFGEIKREKVLTDITIGIKPLDRVLEEVRKWVKQGFKVIKLKMGKGTLEEEKNKLISVVEELPSGTKLRIDANQGWNRKVAKEMVLLANEYSGVIELIEQPLEKDDIEGIGILREISKIPIIVDESIRKVRDFEKVKEFVDGINIKISKAGSIIEAYKLGTLAKESGLKVMIGCSYETNIGITADAYLASIISVDYADLDADLMKDDIVAEKATKLEGSYRVLPKGFGLGIDRGSLNLD